MDPTKVLALVLAGGNGTRLHPLTVEHAKPALPFAAGYRIVDFVLSNLVNSGITSIYVLAQYKPQSLIEHIRAAWAPVLRGPGRFVSVVLPGAESARAPFLGTADAVHKNMHLCARHAPDLVAVFAADHVYRMDVGQMVEAHVQSKADISVAAVPVPVERASPFGIIAAQADGRIREFQEKPERPAPIPERPSHAYASMGNYLFDPGVLAALLDEAARRGDTDFGRHILPRAAATHRVFAYDFAGNRVPGMLPHEEPNYWRDVGTVEAYRSAQRDASGPRPKFSLANEHWPIGGSLRGGVVERVAAAH
ncbi:MAG: sugar phosphate nucleotidyltransferase [Burkholderiales bacterium]